MRKATLDGPTVWLVGEVDHPDFADALALVRASAVEVTQPPELIVLLQSRPGVIAARNVERLRLSAPIAGIVAIAGSWCEGEPRTGRPVPGVPRVYWYEFPGWWWRQLALRAAGLCPDWARQDDARLQFPVRLDGPLERIAVEAASWETWETLSDVMKRAGGETIWLRPERAHADLRGVTAGIWEGGQLDDAESRRLAAFCAKLAANNAPVLALLDFPRRDRCKAARQAGAAAVLGKPWLNAELVATLRQVVLLSSSPAYAA